MPDNSIKVSADISLNTKQAEQQFKQLGDAMTKSVEASKSIREMTDAFNKISTRDMSKQMSKVVDGIREGEKSSKQLEGYISSASNEMERLKAVARSGNLDRTSNDAMQMSGEYKKLIKDAQDYQEEIRKTQELLARGTKTVASDVDRGYGLGKAEVTRALTPDEIESANQYLTSLQGKIQDVETEMQNMEQRGDAFPNLTSSVETAIVSLNKMSERLVNLLMQFTNLSNSAPQAVSATESSLNGVYNAMGKLSGMNIAQPIQSQASSIEQGMQNVVQSATDGAQQVQQQVENVKQTVAQPVTTQIIDTTAIQNQLQYLSGQLTVLTSTVITQMTAMSNAITSGFKDTSDSVKTDVDEINKNVQDMKEQSTTSFNELGAQVGSSMQQASSQVISGLNNLEQAIKRVKTSSRGVGGGLSSSFNSVYRIVRTIVTSIQRGFREIANTVKKFGSQVRSAFNTALRSAQKLASHMKGSLVDAFKRTSKESSKAFSTKTLKKGLTMLLKYGLGVRSLYFLFRKLRTAIKEGLQNLVLYEKAVGTSNELDSVNTAITNLNTSLLYLKNAWAAAIAPVITYVMPALTSLADKFAQVGNVIARFVGALTGQTTVLNAVRVDAQDYADSLDNTKKSASGASDAVKKLTDRLASFDDLNVLGKDNDDSGSGGGGSGLDEYMPDPADMFEYVDAISDFGKRLREAWKNQNWRGIGTIVAKKIDEAIIKPIRDALDWDNCKDVVLDFINQWGNVLNGFLHTTELFDDIGMAIGRGVTTVAHIISASFQTIELEKFGDDIYRVFKNAVDSVDENAIAEAISEVFLAPIRIANGFFDGKDAEELSTLFTDIGTKIANVINGISWYDIFMGIFNFASSIGNAIIDAIMGFVNGGGFSGMLTQIADAINDAVNQLTPEDFERFGNALGSLLVSVLSDLNTFMSETEGSFDTIIEGVGDALANLPWEDIFENAGEIAVKIINAIIKVLNVVGEHMNDIQENGKTLAQNIGETIGECISQIDFEGMGETFGLIAEGIIDGIISALENSDENGIAGIIAKLAYGFNKADADTFTTIASLTIWGTVAKAIFTGIVNALPAIISANGGQIFGAIGSGLSKAGGASATSGASTAGGAGIASGLWNVGAAGVGVGGATIAVMGLVDALRMMNGEIDETDFGGINEDVDTFGEGFTNAFSSFDQFRLTFALGMEGIGEVVAEIIGGVVDAFDQLGTSLTTLGDNMSQKWEEIKTNVTEAWDNVKETVTTKFDEAKAFVEENIALFKENIAGKWDEFKSDVEEKWQLIKETVTGKVEEFKSDAEEKVETLKTNLVNKWQEIKGSIYEKLVGIKTNMVTVFEQMKDAVKTPINALLGIIESMVNKIIGGVNSVADTFNALPDITLTNPFTGTDYTLGFHIPHLSSVSIPRLAEGAVIPPNKEFMAVLGDQSSGTNIEAPLDTIKQAVAEELSSQMEVLQEGFASVVSAIERKNLVIGDKDIGKANARYVQSQNLRRGASF